MSSLLSCSLFGLSDMDSVWSRREENNRVSRAEIASLSSGSGLSDEDGILRIVLKL
jgi:hypothetical protein